MKDLGGRDMVWSIFDYENSFVKVTKEEVNKIPFLKFKPKGYEGLLPTIVYYHGWHSSKEFKRFEALAIASHGYQVVVPDALFHGERDAIDHDNPENLEKYLWDIVLQSVEESREFIEGIIDNHNCDPSRIGIMGSSMGAITAGGVFPYNSNIKCLIGFSGSFAWTESIKMGQLPGENEENKRKIELYDPMNNKDKINNRSILILHGLEDSSLPIDGQRVFLNEMKPLYNKNLDSLQFIEVPNVNHYITTEMLERSIIWLKENL